MIRELRQRLEGLHRAGVRDLPRPNWIEPVRTDDPVPPIFPQAPAAAAGHAVEQPPRPAGDLPTRKPAPGPALAATSLFQEPGFETAPLPLVERPSILRVLAEEVAICTKCANLAATRTQTVFADGSPTARLMFIGEAPGADEDRTGIPFVGRAGQLLTDMITKGMGLKRQDVYIANILKCRPPENREPSGEEAANCLPYLERQIDIIRPEFICLLGRVAVQYLLGTTLSMGKLRGKWYRYQGIPTIVTYHPAYLLRNPVAKKDAWEDLQILM
ncbi:MAG: uracil-DNA glycosylase, partial [Planctomycetaceae bacterium]|nr:uracil-DNA glycosylase [Planctomycetaceae bacterium]